MAKTGHQSAPHAGLQGSLEITMNAAAVISILSELGGRPRGREAHAGLQRELQLA